MKYDDASWHYDGEFPEDSPREYGGTHIVLFLRWCFVRGWAADEILEDASEEVQNVIDGTLSAIEFLFKCDGKLTDDDLNNEGNAFAEKYYGKHGLYLEDYEKNFGDQMYKASEEEHDFVKFTAMLDARLKSGVLTKS
jgi:hypothetical protein